VNRLALIEVIADNVIYIPQPRASRRLMRTIWQRNALKNGGFQPELLLNGARGIVKKDLAGGSDASVTHPASPLC
jgi:hypothetical protein